MSIDTMVYIGPYAEVHVKVVSKQIDGCKHPGSCPNPSEGTYCSKCGIAASRRFTTEKIEEPKVDYHSLMDDVLTCNSGMGPPPSAKENGETIRKYCFMPNLRKDGVPQREFFPYERHIDALYNWTELNIDEEIKWMEETYAKEIDKLLEAYGEVYIRWGYVQWCS